MVAEHKPSSSGWFAGLLRPSFAVPVFALLLLFAGYQNLVVIPSTIFCYWLELDHSYLWVITPARVALFKLPPAKEIDPLVQSYRQALLGSRDVLETQNAAGQTLFRRTRNFPNSCKLRSK